MARPTIYSDDLAAKLCEHLEAGRSIADSCALVGIDDATYHRWVERGEADKEPFREFCDLTRRARAKGRKHHVDAIRRAAAGDWRAAAWFLERSDPANWGRREKIDASITTPNGDGDRAELAAILVALRSRAQSGSDQGAESEAEPDAATVARHDRAFSLRNGTETERHHHHEQPRSIT